MCNVLIHTEDSTKLSIAVPPPKTSDKVAVKRLNTRFMLPFRTNHIDSNTYNIENKKTLHIREGFIIEKIIFCKIKKLEFLFTHKNGGICNIINNIDIENLIII